MTKRPIIAFLALVAACAAALAQAPVSFAGKNIVVIVGSPPGGGTDASARLTASLMANYLQGKPSILVRNIPGAQGITAQNYFAKQVAPDGLTLMMASTTQADPLLYRKPQAQFDPTTYSYVGGVGRGGTVLLIRKEAEARLHNKTAAPVVMGALGGVPRSGMQTTAWGIEFLGWNAKWVVGYRGTSDLMIALERGEIDMTSTANLFQVQKFLDSGRFKILSQSGALHSGQLTSRPEFGDTPLFAALMQGKIRDQVAQKAFDYWSSMTALDKWFALPPRTPDVFVRAHRAAYKAAAADPEFLELGKKISEDIDPMAYEDVEFLVKRLDGTTPEALAFLSAMLRKQGVEAE